MLYNDFPPGHVAPVLAADTETHTRLNGELVTTAELDTWTVAHSESEARQAITVEVYAWQLSDGRYFAICESFNEFCALICELGAKAVWFYNARFDFAQIDYAVLTDPAWERSDGRMKGKQCYSSLHGRQGQRYCYALSFPYRAKDRHKQTHQFRLYDFCLILGGGLAKVLTDLNVVDFDGVPVRKLEMDYQSEVIDASAIAYMRNDVVGLFHAVRLFGDFSRERFGVNVYGEKPDAFTAGGLAKRVMLSYICDGSDHAARVKEYQRAHRISAAIDEDMRKHSLLRGGIALVNPRFQGRIIRAPMWRGDVNSMHPAQMRKAIDLYAPPRKAPAEAWKTPEKDTEYILCISYCRGQMKDGKLPFFYDPGRCEYVKTVDTDTVFYIFSTEWERLLEWYDLDYTVDYCITVKRRTVPAWQKFIDDAYQIKVEGKKQHNGVMTAFGKLLLNSSYGKLGECPTKELSHYEISDETGAAHLIDDGFETDEKSLLSIVNAARITRDSRISLMDYCDFISGGRPGDTVVYVDTDSVHTTAPVWDGCDPYTIGALKNETPDGVCPACYLAPKTYVDFTLGVPEFHTKGVNIKAVKAYFAGKTPDEILQEWKPGLEIATLGAINVRGGKALILRKKYVCKPTDTVIFNDGETEQSFFEA